MRRSVATGDPIQIVEACMLLRIVRGKLKPGNWHAFEAAYKKAVADAGPIEGLCGRWLVQDVNDPDSGSTISLWATADALHAYESSDTLKNKIAANLAPYFSGQYDTRVSKVCFAEGDPAPSEWLSPLEC
jgi:heme-degrading monooxygenase HmoA